MSRNGGRDPNRGSMTPTKNTRSLEGLKIGDRVSIQHKLGSRSEKYVVKTAPVTKMTPAAIHADGKRFSRTTWRGLDGYDSLSLLGPSTPEEISAWNAKIAEQKEKDEARERAQAENVAKRAELQALIEPLGATYGPPNSAKVG
jgi:hypothetical protein